MQRVVSLLLFSFISLLVFQTRPVFMFSSPLRATRTRLFARNIYSKRAMTTTTTSTSVYEVAHRLVNSTEKAFVCIAVAGGGSHAISALASTPGASSILLEATLAYDRNSFHNYIHHHQDDDISYVSSEAAHLLSQAALLRAMKYKPLHQQYCIGIGASSALKQNKPNRLDRGYIVATHATGKTWECYMEFSSSSTRTRVQQDEFLARLILESIPQVVVVSSNDSHDFNPLLDDNDDKFQQWHSPGIASKDAVFVGAERVLLGETPAVVLLPEAQSFVSVPHVVLPNKSLVFPGSFNPPHVGHVALANAAKCAFFGENSNALVLFELSLQNADKAPMDATTVSERAHKILELENLPSNWGVLLTSVPLFAEKANILRDCIVTDIGSKREMAFVIGTDTMVRILNPKYYGDSEEAMLEAIRDMKRLGIHFVVGGRLQQGNVENDVEFVTGEEELAGLPPDVQEMFTLVKEEDFRVDLSSTELRKQAEAKKLPSP